MTTTALDAGPLSATQAPIRGRLRAILASIGLGAASGGLLWASYPPLDLGALAWVALIPLLVAIVRSRSRGHAAVAGLAFGLSFWGPAVEWVMRSDPSAWLGWVVLAGYKSLYGPAFALLIRSIASRGRASLVLAVPSVWVGFEFIRAYALTGLPWFFLAHSQYRFLPWIQVSDLAGAYGLSFVIASAATGLTLALLRAWDGSRSAKALAGPLAIPAALMAITLGYGYARMASAEFRPGPTVGLLQSNIEQKLRNDTDPELILKLYQELMRKAVEGGAGLLVWPETSFPYAYTRIEPGMSEARLAEIARQVDPDLTIVELKRRQDVIGHLLRDMTTWAGVPLVVGVSVVDYRPDGRWKYNSALLLRPGSATEQRYDKLHLVPFGEYVPLLNTFPWLTRLTPYHGEMTPSLTPGRSPAWFRLGELKMATAICFEDTIPYVVRRAFGEVRDGHPPDILLNLSNDGWFRGSAELDNHLAISVFRAVEHRVPLVRAVNTGISALVDGNGRIVARLPKLAEDVLIAPIPLDDREGLYAIVGDWLPWCCLIATILMVIPSFPPLWKDRVVSGLPAPPG